MYPPKVHQFAYVTDEACTEDEILSMEIIIMKVQLLFSIDHSMTFFCLFLIEFPKLDSILFDSVANTRFLFSIQELKWSLSPQTPIAWLNVYMQVAYLKDTDELLLPRYPQETFTQIAQVRFFSIQRFI